MNEPDEKPPLFPKLTTLSLMAIKERNLPHYTAMDFFVREEPAEDLEVQNAAIAAADKYLHAFVKSDTGGCVCCGKPQGHKNGSKFADAIADSLLFSPQFVWGLAHGEGYCATCGYPARAYHSIEGVGDIRHLILQYHPDGLEPPS